MAASIRCPECQGRLTLKTAPAPGARVKCPKCSTSFRPAEATEPEQAPQKTMLSRAKEAAPAAGKKTSLAKGDTGKVSARKTTLARPEDLDDSPAPARKKTALAKAEDLDRPVSKKSDCRGLGR